MAWDGSEEAAVLAATRVPLDAALVVEFIGDHSQAAGLFLANPDRRILQVDLRRIDAGGLAQLVERLARRGDCVLVHDAVAACADPDMVLAAATALVAPAGQMVVCLPKAGFDWPAPAPGRLWTEGDFAAMCLAAGLTPLLGRYVRPRGGPAASHILGVAGRCAQPVAPLLVHAVTRNPVGGLNNKRIYEPLDAIATVPGVRVQGGEGVLNAVPEGDDIAGDKIAILQRLRKGIGDMPRIRRLAANGWVLVTEFDDLPTLWPDIAEHGNTTFRAVHAVQTSTPALADYLAPFNPEIATFPNQMARLAPRRPRRRRPAVEVFFGAFNREADWPPVLDRINAVARRHGPRLSFQVLYDRRFYDALETPHKTFTGLQPYAGYLKLLGACDIALLPLADNDFNRAKSDLKFIECAAHQVAVLASPVVYAGTVADGDTGFLYGDPDSFEAKLEALVGDDEGREDMIERAYQYVRRERLLVHHYRRRLDWYRSLVDRRQALTEGLLERIAMLEEHYRRWRLTQPAGPPRT